MNYYEKYQAFKYMHIREYFYTQHNTWFLDKSINYKYYFYTTGISINRISISIKEIMASSLVIVLTLPAQNICFYLND